MSQKPHRILSVVPKEHQWLRDLTAVLSRAKIPWHNAVLADRVLKIQVSGRDEPFFALVARLPESDMPGYKRTSRFVIGYDGSRSLTAQQRDWLDRFYGWLSSAESSLPPELEGFAAIGNRIGAPEDIIRGMFPFVTVERSQVVEDPGQGEVLEVLVRATSRCNQACPFCSAPRHDEPDSKILWACLRAASDLLPGAMVSLTGGEPTLRPAFLAEVEATLSLNFSRVQIQTNAVRFADRLDPGSLPKSDLLTFFVSLHALDQAIYDSCTGTNGQLPHAQTGLVRILEAGHDTIVNTVICRENIHHLNEMVQRLADMVPGDNRPVMHFSVLICPEWNPEAAKHLVRYSEVVPALTRASETARGLGLNLQLSSTHASLPVCLLGGEADRHYYEIQPNETGYEDYARPWVKADGCRECRETQHCLGVPRPYAEKFGLEELAPLEAEE